MPFYPSIAVIRQGLPGPGQALFTNRRQYNNIQYDYQNGGYNTDVSESEQVRNEVYIRQVQVKVASS